MESSAAVQPAPVGAGCERNESGSMDLAVELTAILADVFALYIKTKNFHWHVTGPHFQDHHLLLDGQATQLLAIADSIAERVRKIGFGTLRSISGVARRQRVADDERENLSADEMFRALREDNTKLVAQMREAHRLSEGCADVATASLLETWIDEAEGRLWFLSAVMERSHANG